jgi:hypothetical protein
MYIIASYGLLGQKNISFTSAFVSSSAGAFNSTKKILSFTSEDVGPSKVKVTFSVDISPLTYSGVGNSMGGALPVYAIYYTAAKNYYSNNNVGYFSRQKQLLVSNFINGLTSSVYFDTVRQYTLAGAIGSIYLAGSYIMDCNTDSWSKGCSLGVKDAGSIIAAALQTSNSQKTNYASYPLGTNSNFTNFPANENAIYLLVLAPEVTETYVEKSVMGSEYCGCKLRG